MMKQYVEAIIDTYLAVKGIDNIVYKMEKLMMSDTDIYYLEHKQLISFEQILLSLPSKQAKAVYQSYGHTRHEQLCFYNSIVLLAKRGCEQAQRATV
ncbi:hypothetical protein N9R79_03780 [Vibrio sp.]|nr:hypothetical protein [Vibrio sp.]